MVQGRVFKISTAVITSLLSGLAFAADLDAEAVPGEYVVKAKNVSALRSLSAPSMLGAESVRPISRKSNLFVVKRSILERSENAMTSLAANPNIEIVEPNYIYRINRTPNDPKLGELWGIKNSAQKGGRQGMDVNAEMAWDITTGSNNVVVAVIDTGVDYTHPDIEGNVWVNQAEKNGQAGVDDDGNGYVDDIHGYDFVNNDGNPIDDHGHGTHCAGTIAAQGDDGKGIVGVAWDARVMGVKFLSAQGSGTLENAIKAIDYATNNGAVIQSNSWGGGGYSELLKQAIERSREKNVIFVAAAGNDSNNNDANPSYPASYDVANIVAVAALNNQGQLAYFSSYGKTKVHVAAPGVDVFSSVPSKTDPSGYATWSGTSMATPHVSGIAVLLLSMDPQMTYADAKARMMKSCRPISSLRAKAACGGMIDAYLALTNQSAPPDMEDPSNWMAVDRALSSAHPYSNNYEETFQVTVEGATQVAIYFERFETERGYDFVEFKDASGTVLGKWSGNHNGEFSPTASGNTIFMTFKADNTVAGYGFDITKAAYR